MSPQTFESLVPDLRASLAAPAARPGLLYDEAALEAMRKRAAAHPELTDRILRRADELVAARDLSMEPEPYYVLGKLATMTEAQMLAPSARYERHILDLLRATAEAPTWVCHVHPGMLCDHCAPNTAAAVVLAMEALGPALPAREERALAARCHEMCLGPFLECCRKRLVFWAHRDHPFNWRIMTCGEAGLAALGVDVPDRREIVEFAMEGVADVLDRVPPDGDWQEGPGYWVGTLLLGLRFALALRRATGGRVDMFAHPALRATADYFTCITLPDGSAFNYADNSPGISSTALHVLASEMRSGTMAWTARRIGHASAWDVMFDDPGVHSQEPPNELQARVFPTTGLAVSRSDWGAYAVFVGLKSGPTAVGHSHLDLQSFIISRGGARLLIDPGIWPYGSSVGFFDSSPGGRRWDFDANATVAHNTVLVDGQGQTWGPECAGRFVAQGADGGLRWFVSDAAAAYPGLLTRFDRWLVHLLPDTVLVYDDLAADRPRHWQWLLHAGGTVGVTRTGCTIESGGVALSVARLLPPADAPWRNVEEARTSFYEDSDALADTEQTIHVHRFGPMLPSQEIEFLWVLQVGRARGEWTAERDAAGALMVRGPAGAVRIDRAGRLCVRA
jgi:hypothetical protein